MTQVNTRTPDNYLPLAREHLPFWIEQTPYGPEMCFEAPVTIGLTGEIKMLPMRYGGNNRLSWQQLREPICRLMEMFRNLESRYGQTLGELERLRQDATLLSGERDEAVRRARSAEAEAKRLREMAASPGPKRR